MKSIVSATKLNNSKELVESLKEYRSILEKAKSQQSLKNYHKKFREHLKFKLDKSQEKQCEKISNSIAPSKYSLHSFNIWPLLYSQKNKKLEILVPTTLYRDEKREFLAKSEEFLEFYNGPEILEMFLKDLPKLANLPVCIFKPIEGKIKLFSSQTNLKLFINRDKNFRGYFQYFIPPNNLNANLILVNYHKGSLIKPFVLKNSTEIPVKESFKEKTLNQADSLTTDKILHSMLTELSKKNSASPIKRKVTFDFNSSINNSAILQEQSSFIEPVKVKKFTNLAQRIKSLEGFDDFTSTESLQIFLDNNTSKFIVDLSNTKMLTSYNIKAKLKTVEYMTKGIFSLIEKFVKNKFGKDLLDINVSFLKDSCGNWLFLKVNALKYAQPYNFEEYCEIFDSMDETSFHMSFMENSRILNTTFIPIVQNAQRKVSELKPVIKIKNVKDLKAKHLKFVKKRTCLSLDLDVKKYINDAAQNLDLMKRNIILSKKNYVDLAIKYSASTFWKGFTVQVYKIILRSHIGKYFKIVLNEKFHSMANGLFRVFCSNIGPHYIRDLARIHKNLNISSEDYSEFKLIFMNNISYYVNDKNDMELIEINIESLRSCITNSNT